MTMTGRKKLIEVALPLEAINVAAAREKSIRHGHPSTLHLWWARRPLAAARATVFATLVDDPDSDAAPPAFVEACNRLPIGNNVKANGDTPRMRLFDFIERLVTWEATSDESIMAKARELIRLSNDGNPPALLDPFAGGGSIPLEAQRLGLEAFASDLNPVAVMINKAQIEIPPRFAGLPPVNPDKRAQIGQASWQGAAGLADDVRYYGEWVRQRAEERIGHLFPSHNGETVIAWLWARTVLSPNPTVNAHVPLLRQFQLSKKKGRECWAKPIIEGGRVRFEVAPGKPPQEMNGTVGREIGGGRCIISGAPFSLDYIRAEGTAGRMGAQLIAIVTEGANRRNYHSPTADQEAMAAEAQALAAQLENVPTQAIPYESRAKISGLLYGLTTYSELFTPRQLVALSTFSALVAEAREQVYRDALAAGWPDDDRPLRDGGRGARAYAEALSVYLAFAVDRAADYWSSIANWQNIRETIRNTFARQAIPMTWDYAEGNPFSRSSGNWMSHVDWIVKVLAGLPASGRGQAWQQDAARLQIDAQVISTDPPYYDNINYADLSDFFYVWLRRNLRDVYPDVFSTLLVPKEPELIASPYRHGGKEGANAHFEGGMRQTFSHIRQHINPDYPLTIYYAFKQQDAADTRDQGQASTGWETMLTSLIEAGFAIDGTWPMRTERNGRPTANGKNALASSIVLVCRPRPEDAPVATRRQFMDALQQELPPAIHTMQQATIAPVDMAQASIGPGMAIFSRYRRVLEADGRPLTVRDALGLINIALDEFLKEQDSDIDTISRFAVEWFEQFGFEEGDFGQADVLARAKNTSVESVELAGVAKSSGGKVRLIHWSEYDAGEWDPQQDKRPTVWEGVHHLIERLNSHGEAGAALLLTKMSTEMITEVRQLAYRLYNICERKNWTEHAFDYNALIMSWSGIGEVADEKRQSESEGIATHQNRMF